MRSILFGIEIDGGFEEVGMRLKGGFLAVRKGEGGYGRRWLKVEGLRWRGVGEEMG